MEPLETLKHYFGYDTFRGIQEDIVRSIYSGHDTLGLMPTGGGKSISFQVPALMMDGVCIVITPLISLMKDQVMHLKERGIKAEAIYSGLTNHEIHRILDNAIYGAVKFLYVSPERLHTKSFLSKLYYIKVCFITVDEAHCISQWGYDFRPSYLQICRIRELKPECPVLALTATATPAVVDDIQDRLSFKVHNVFRMSFKRPNISYVVRHTFDDHKELLHILNAVKGSAIVYVTKREETKEVSEFLNAGNISATFYHAGLDIAIKDTRQEEWQRGIYRVMVATNAFGMGIDKPDVRLVIHLDSPASLEEYFQEAGRAGRDGRRAYAVLLCNMLTTKRLRLRANGSFPSKENIRKVYDHLAYFFQLAENSGQDACYEFNLELFCLRFRHFPPTVESCLRILQNAGYLEYEPEPDSSARVMFLIARNELYELQGLSQLENDILNALLRCYGALFSELTFINERALQQHSGYDENHIHVALKSLSQRHIIRYVPKRAVPLIRYTQQRIDSARLRFPRSVYEDLQEKMSQRVDAMIRYLENTSLCRVNILLEYFGEQSTEDCHHCDVCLNKKADDRHDTENVNSVLAILSDHKRHLLNDIISDTLTQREKEHVMEHLRNDAGIVIKDNFILLKE